jgi:threonine dehydrogenase-like Zn-dependent dehydrogenase
VEAIGEDVIHVAVGDRVACLSNNSYAEHDLADARTVVKLACGLEGKPFPGEPLGCVMNIFRRSDIAPGQTVAIVGVGFIGAALTELAVRAGARVIAFSRRTFALEIAEWMGASALIRMDDPAGALRQAVSLIGEARCERVIEASGHQEALDLATELTGVRARLVIAGYHQDGERRVNLQEWNWRGLDVVNAHERSPYEQRRGMQEAADLVARGELQPWRLFTHHFALEEAQDAFQTLAQRPHGFLKALISCV